MSSPDTTVAATGDRSTELSQLNRASVRGGTLTLISQGAGVAIQMTSTVTLARLLSPEDYGAMTMVASITSFAQLFRDLGLSAAAVQKGTLSQAQMSNLFWLNVAVGSVLTLALAAAAPLVAWFYGVPELLPLTVLLSTTFIVASLGTQQGALMQRQMQFGRRAAAGIAGSLVGVALSIFLGFRGHGYWALAWGNVAASVITTASLFALGNFRPGWWTPGAGLRSMVAFGAHVTAFDFVNYLARNLDNILIGKQWGADALGLYGRAYQLLMFPITNLRTPIATVAFPAMSRLQGQPESFRSYYRGVTGLIAALTMPIAAYSFVMSHDIVRLLLGERWVVSADIFSVLALVALVQPASSFRGTVLMSLGLSRRYLRQGAFVAFVTSVGFLIGVRWGVMGVAVAYVATSLLLLYPVNVMCFKGTPIRMRDFASCVAVPLLASLGAASVLSLLARGGVLVLGQGRVVDVIVSLVIFAGAYVAIGASFPDFRRKVFAARRALRGAA